MLLLMKSIIELIVLRNRRMEDWAFLMFILFIKQWARFALIGIPVRIFQTGTVLFVLINNPVSCISRSTQLVFPLSTQVLVMAQLVVDSGS